MKKLFLLLILSPLSLFAQIDLGVKAGLSTGNTTHVFDIPDSGFKTDWFRSKWIAGFYFGLYFQKSISDEGKVQVEVLSAMKGSAINLPGAFKLNEITVPISYIHSFERLSLGIGHEVGLDLSESKPNIDLSLFGSLSFRLVKKISIDLRFLHGYNTVSEILLTSGNLNGTAGIRTRVIQFGLNYKLTEPDNSNSKLIM